MEFSVLSDSADLSVKLGGDALNKENTSNSIWIWLDLNTVLEVFYESDAPKSAVITLSIQIGANSTVKKFFYRT